MPNRFQIKRTTTTGLLPNVSNSSNTSYIAAGELAINLTDRKLLSSNGSATFEVGANLASMVVGTAFTQTSGNANFDSGVLFVDGTNNRVGVNNTTPGHALSITGTTNLGGVVTITSNATLSGTNTHITSTNTSITSNVTISGTLNTTNPIFNNIKHGYTTTATAAGTTILTSSSNYMQFFTGTTTQVLSLPAPQTMTLGQGFLIVNNSTGNIEVRAANAATVITVLPGTVALCTSIDLTAGNGAAGWNAEFVGFSGITGTGNVVLATSPTLTGNVTLGSAVANTSGLFVTSAAPQLSLNNTTSNFVSWSTAGVDGPSINTRSPGTKLLLYPALSVSQTDYAIGISAATIWSSVPVNSDSFKFKWYGADIEVASLSGTGNFTVTGYANVSSTLAAGNTTITGFINVSSAANLNSLTVQNTVITANLEVTDTATINTNSIVVGNTTVNSTYGTSEIKVANSTNSVTITAAQVSVGANVYANTTAVDVGNTIITTTNLTLGGTVTANGSTGTAGQVLISSGASANAYWSGFNTGPAFSAYPNSSIQQTITSGSQQKVLFQVEEYDTNNNFASSRFTPTVAGYYQLNTVVRMSGTMGTGESMIVIWKNGSEYKRGWNASGTEVGANFFAMGVSTLAYANGAGDYFEVYVQQGSGGNRDVTVAGGNITWFNGSLVRSG
jgi:hypothetical protein